MEVDIGKLFESIGPERGGCEDLEVEIRSHSTDLREEIHQMGVPTSAPDHGRIDEHPSAKLSTARTQFPDPMTQE